MKELSATLLLRPIGSETLANWLYAEASRGTYEEGAVAALMIVLVGLLTVVLLARTGVRDGREGMACARRCWTSMASRLANPRRDIGRPAVRVRVCPFLSIWAAAVILKKKL